MRHKEIDLKAKKLRKLLAALGFVDEDMRLALMLIPFDLNAVERAIRILRLAACEEGIEEWWRAAQKAASAEKESKKKLKCNSTRASKAEQPYAVELVLVESHR